VEIAKKYMIGDMSGWRPDPKHAANFAGRNRTPLFGVSAPLIMDQPRREVFLPAYLSMVMREKDKEWRYKSQYQKRGTCVGQGYKLSCDIVMAVNRLIGGMRFPGRAAVAPIYAGSRVEVANQAGRWDGSNGSWASDWVTKYGVVLLKELGLPEDALDSDEKFATSWAARSSGVPAEYETAARVRPIKNSSLVTDTDEVAAGLGNLQPVPICTSLIPSPNRNRDGIARMSSQGGHCTVIVGMRKVGRNWVFAYHQSWNGWAKGHYGWQKHDPIKEYSSCIVDITESDLAKVLRSRDCYTLMGVSGTEPIDTTFFI
jgi:hypothetical protein